MKYWLLKSEPSVYPYRQLAQERRTAWTGVRNFEARNNLRATSPGDLALFYHSGEEKSVVGVARIVSPPQPDPTSPGEDWSSVDVEPVAALKQPVTLRAVKADPDLKGFSLASRPRLSVTPVTSVEFRRILKLGQTKL